MTENKKTPGQWARAICGGGVLVLTMALIGILAIPAYILKFLSELVWKASDLLLDALEPEN